MTLGIKLAAKEIRLWLGDGSQSFAFFGVCCISCLQTDVLKKLLHFKFINNNVTLLG